MSDRVQLQYQAQKAPEKYSTHLQVLVILNYVAAGFLAIPALYLLLMFVIFTCTFFTDSHVDSVAYCGIIILLIVIGATTIELFRSGRNITRRERRGFSCWVAVLSLLYFPLGTILGIYGLVILTRPSVKAMYVAAG